MVANVEKSIWDRVIEPAWDGLDPSAAGALLKLRFREADVTRMNELAALARDGTLDAGQQEELDTYMKIGNVLAILQSKARLALKSSGGR